MLSGLHRSWRSERRRVFRARRLGTTATVIVLSHQTQGSQAFFVSATVASLQSEGKHDEGRRKDTLATCLCPPPPLAFVAPPLPLSPRHPRLPTRLPAGPKSCRPSTVQAVEHAPMHAKKACCGLAPVPRANTLNVRLLLSADEMSCFLAPQLSDGSGYRQRKQSEQRRSQWRDR